MKTRYTKAPLLTTFEGRRKWERATARDFPVRFFLYERFPIWWHRNTVRRVKDAYWWFRHRLDPRTRFHVVHTGLAPGYYDQDKRMLHACFSLLVDFVEEKLEVDRVMRDFAMHEGLAGSDDDAIDDDWVEALALHQWWTTNRDHNDPDTAEDDAMLRRLVVIRTYLWV